MGVERRRRFTILDALILIVAVGIGLAWMREFTHREPGGESYPDGLTFHGRSIPAPVRAVLIGLWWVEASYNLAAAVTIALVFLRTLPPRPTLRRLSRRPGAVACAAIAFAVSVEMLATLSDIVSGVRYNGMAWSELWSLSYWNIAGVFQSLAVAVAWLLMAWGGRWKPERGWLDRFGTILGAFWLIVPPLLWLIRDLIIDAIWLT